MYLRKASEDHLPIIMMENVGTPSRYMAIAAPDRREWVPISSLVKPSFSSPMTDAAERSLFLAVLEDIRRSRLLSRMVLTVVSADVSG